MKLKTKTLTLLTVAFGMMSCSSDELKVTQDPKPTEVTLTFSPYEIEPLTRAATSIGDNNLGLKHLDVWFYESGSEVAAIHQTKDSDSDNFGNISVTLDKTKTYTIYAVAHKADGAELSDGIITFTDDKVTHSMYYTQTFTPATTTNLSCVMQRIVAMFKLVTTDAVPGDCKKIQFTVNGIYNRWNVLTSSGTNLIDRTSSVTISSTAADGTVTCSVFAIVTTSQTPHTITVTALDINGDPLDSQAPRVFENVPLRNGYVTTYRGQFFVDTPTSSTFTVNDWNTDEEGYTIEF